MLKRLIPIVSAVLLVTLSSFSATDQKTPATASQGGRPNTIGTISVGGGPEIKPVPENYRFPNGQVLHYTAEWRLWNAGVATMRIDPVGANQQRVTVTAESTGFVALLYRVQDRFESLFDRRTFCSIGIVKHSEEGLHRRETSIKFDQTARKAFLDEKNLRSGETKHTAEDIPGCVTDVVSGIYYVASLPLEPGASHSFPLSDGGKTVIVHANVEAREEIQTDAGTFKTVRVQPYSDTGVLRSRGKVWIWYTDDAQHIPVQMRARLFWGSLTIKLARVERQP